MLDLSHIPNSQQDIKIFYSNGITNAWQTWTKPRKCQWVWIMAIGGGGGGAGGATPINNAGTGGGSGGVTRAIFNASHLPDTLFIQVGLGGAGGTSNVNGSGGTRSTISILPNTTTTNGVLSSGTNATAGAGGQFSGTAVAGEVAYTTANSVFGSLSTFVSTQGVSSGGPNGFFPLSNITPLTSQITCPGASGAGMGSTPPAAINAASILATSISPLIAGGSGSAAAATNGGDGANGITSWKPFFSLGGAGGGNAVSGSGGRGGNGGIGSGGGAGGASATATGGTGGKGGDGLVVIISF